MGLPEDIRKRIAQAQSRIGNSGVKWLTLEAGKPVDIHILFGEYGIEKLWYVKQGIHYLGEGKTQIRVTCPRVTAEGICPICDASKALRDEISAKKRDLEGNRKTMSADQIRTAENDISSTEEMEDSFYVSIRFVFNVVVKGETAVRLFNCPKTVFEEIFAVWAKNIESVDMFDPMNSFYFTVLRTGTGQNDTRYTVTPNMIPIPLVGPKDAPNKAEIDKIVAARHDLDNEIKVPTTQEVADIFGKFINGEPQTEKPADKPATPTPQPQPQPQTASTTATQSSAEMSPAARLRAKLANPKG